MTDMTSVPETDRPQAAPDAPVEPPEAGRKLGGNKLGVSDLVYFVVAAAAPLTVMAGVAPLAIQFGGLGAPGGYLIGGIVMAVFAVGFTAMSRFIPNPGAFYSYIGQGLGRQAGAGGALLAVAAYNLIQVGLLGAFAAFAASTFADVLGISLEWWVWGTIGIALIAWLGYRSVTLSAKVLGVALALEVAILLVLAVPVILDGGASGLSAAPFEPGNIFTSGVGALFVLSFGAFLGFESTAIYSAEARDRQRTVPRATYIAVGFLAVFYALIVWMIIMAFGPDRAIAVANENPAEMFFIASSDYVGGFATDVMRLLIVTSAFAASLAFHNVAARYHHALGSEGVLPRVLSHTHPRYRSPVAGSVIQTVFAAIVVACFAIAGADPYLQLLLWASGPGILGVLVLQAICSVAVLSYFRRRHAPGTSVWTRVVAPALAAVALTIVCGLIVANFELLTAGSTLLNAGLIAPLVVFFVAGVMRARYLRNRKPDVYWRLTTTEAS